MTSPKPPYQSKCRSTTSSSSGRGCRASIFNLGRTETRQLLAQKEDENAMAAIEKSGRTKIIHLSPEQRAVWAKALLPVREEVAGRLGKDVIDQVEKEQAVAASD